ncbi:hypothetical protein [Salinifilum ghardaiensis]
MAATNDDFPAVLGELGEPPATARGPRELLVGYLDVARELIDGTTGE